TLASREFHLDMAAPGHIEFDGDEYVNLAFDGIREVLGAEGVESRRVKAIGLSSQAQTFVVLGADERPLRPAISWLDIRATKEAEELSEASKRLGRGEVDIMTSGPKLLWLRRNEPDVMARTRRVLHLPDYFIFRLTGRGASDPVTAGTTAMHDSRTDRWVEELLEVCGLRPEMMAEVMLPGEPAGNLTPAAAEMLGLSKDVIVAVGSNDQLTGAIGAGNVIPGYASVAMGTALAMIITTETDEGLPKGVWSWPHAARGLTALLIFAKTAGIVLRWFRDTFAPGLSYEELFEEVAAVPIGAEGVSCLPHFTGTATPTYNPMVRGAFSGLTLSHGRGHLARAIVEALSFTVGENLDLVAPMVGRMSSLRMIGGGARSDIWLQMIADATGVPTERPVTREAACLGGAELGMVAAGRFKSVKEASLAIYQAEKRFEPDASLKGRYDEAFERYRALYESLYGE
ncbi:MAG: FGGY family carbohydrate kinase, partial [Planctomycetia bacterium]|nr:FGGY family carbohydrate kinase [Planctomycetia bacterium]